MAYLPRTGPIALGLAIAVAGCASAPSALGPQAVQSAPGLTEQPAIAVTNAPEPTAPPIPAANSSEAPTPALPTEVAENGAPSGSQPNPGTTGESPTGQYRCRAVLQAETEFYTTAVGIEFVYPQVRMGEFLDVQVTTPEFDQQTDPQRAWFSTAGEDGYWTLPVVQGIAPIILTQTAAIKIPEHERLSAEFCGSPVVPVTCVPL